MSQVVANLPITAVGTVGTGSLSGTQATASYNISLQSPGPGMLVIDLFSSQDAGVTWDNFTSFAANGYIVGAGDPSGQVQGTHGIVGVGGRLSQNNTASTLFRMDVRSITGGTWTALSIDVTS